MGSCFFTGNRSSVGMKMERTSCESGYSFHL